MHFLIWSKPFEFLCTIVSSGRSWNKCIHLKIILAIVQLIWIFNMFITRVQTCKNISDQNSGTRETMFSNGLKTVIFRPYEIIIPLVLEIWSKLFLQVWTIVKNILKIQMISWQVWFLNEYIFLRKCLYIRQYIKFEGLRPY